MSNGPLQFGEYLKSLYGQAKLPHLNMAIS